MCVPRSNRDGNQSSTTNYQIGSRSVPTYHDVESCRSSSTRIRLLAGVVAALLLAGAPVTGFMITPAQAQASVSVQFRTALQDHGRWQRHSRWGGVWIPSKRPRDWRACTNGHLVFTDEL